MNEHELTCTHMSRIQMPHDGVNANVEVYLMERNGVARATFADERGCLIAGLSRMRKPHERARRIPWLHVE
jgi:hypothetical protein